MKPGHSRLLVATHNRGKLAEFRELFGELPFDLVTLQDVGIHKDIEETGATFAENARLKAHAYAAQSGLLTLADDSGLEVDVLGGEPGVYSKRYAGEDKTDAERNAYLLAKLRTVASPKRTARFRCTIVIADPQGNEWQSDGTLEGAIAFEARGTNGFGYDPIFIVRGSGKHLAELDAAEKNKVSHRARAAEGAREILRRLSSGQRA